jgi:pseudouridine kinase
VLPNVVVIGTVFIDCKGFAKQCYNPVGRNLGSIHFVHGGVGRNVAENLANLQVPNTFISSVDKTAIGEEVIIRLQKAGIDTRFMAKIDRGMGFWLAVLDEKGDLAGSVSQMPQLIFLEDVIRQEGRAIVQNAAHIILELDLNAIITQTVIDFAKEYGRPVYGIPGNLDVISANPRILQDLECFICNDIEAERLLGVTLRDRDIEEIQKKLESFARITGFGSMVITLGSRGSIYFDARNGYSGFQPVYSIKMVDSSGAGDAFFSGTVMGLIRRYPLAKAVCYGTKVAAWTIEASENICTELAAKMQSDKLFSSILQEINLEKGPNL